MPDENTVNPGTFGPGVIGEEAHKLEQAVVEKQANIFGPGVVGLASDPLNKPGPGVIGDAIPDTLLPSLSIRELGEALEKNPALLDKFFLAELERPGGPRKGALDLFYTTESAKTEPRADVLERIREKE